MRVFNEQQFQTLTLICDTLAPALAEENDTAGFYARRATDLGIPERMVESIAQYAEPGVIPQLQTMLDYIETPWFNALFSGIHKAFSEMTLAERTRLLVTWAASSLSIRRKAFQALKRLALFYFYSVPDGETHYNPNWAVIGYTPPPMQPLKEKPIKPISILADTVLETEIVIVGSGAGGGVIAGELAGHDTIIVEKGNYYAEDQYGGSEHTSLANMFDNGGFLVNHDLSISLLAGNTLGGGTTVNWCGAIRTPDHVLEEWADEFGLTELTTDLYHHAMDAVAERIHVNSDHSQMNPQNRKLEEGAQKLGYHVEVIPRNVDGCQDCGFCNHGCAVGAKRSTLKTYLLDAYNAGARILVKTRVHRVLIENGRAVGVEATSYDDNGILRRVIIHAKRVVVAAGSIHTPALLLRSGLANHHIGRNLHIHPTSVIYGMYDEPICGWSGVMMSRVVKQFANLHEGYGVLLETAPVHPGIAAMSLSWQSGYQHKSVMAKLNQLASTTIITRDRDGGQVKLDQQGNPRIIYTLSPYDAHHLMRGVIESLRIQHAAGAIEISAPYTLPYLYRPKEAIRPLEDYLNAVVEKGFRPNNFALLSAHQMSSARMSSSPRLGAVQPSGETFEVKNLYVADASVLPTASGVNPMLTIMAMARRIATYLKASLA